MTIHKNAFTVILSAITVFLFTTMAYANSLQLTAKEAYQKAEKGEIVLVDIREPQEWKATGVSSKAKLIAMRDPKFLVKLKQIKLAFSGKPIAVICAHGNRSRYVQKALVSHGYKVVDVLKGMESAGGWIKSGLPVKKWVKK